MRRRVELALFLLAMILPLSGCAIVAARIRRSLCDRRNGTLAEVYDPATKSTRHLCITGGGAGRGYSPPVDISGGPDPADPNP